MSGVKRSKNMKPQEFYYSVMPIEKKVTREEFDEFLKNYPRSLVRDVYGVCEPPCVSYNDFELADRWPYSIVASTGVYSDNPDDYYYVPRDERRYTIMINYKEVFDSRTGNKTED